ncbi:acyltransferase [Paenibacillus sp. H1-7]|uniref:acyltransferase family protein n=1 Tax=Paenibacillus sp. H1-7 TaxID=2282849 RepID=UPI001EF816EF|nr:acyltransferase [Paenibacillus sp. H1-7]ULL18826.1 acyltransferase [Paenibacillus sp. H1-7]
MEKRLAIPFIQAARGVAVVLVMLFHTAQMADKYFHIDFLGISDMGRSGGYAYFFVLTGFLMYTIYHNQFGHAEVWRTFIVKRFLRIFPLYWLVTAAVLPVYFLVPSFGLGFETKPSVILQSLLLLPQSHAPILPVAWSLTYIVFFYLAFSLSFVLSRRTVIVIWTLWLAIVCLINLGWIHLKEDVWIHFLFDALHLEFVLGVAIAWLVRRFTIRYSGYWLAAGILVFPLVWILRWMNPNVGYINTMYTVGSALVLIGIGALRTETPAWIKPLQFLGDASYSILLTSLACLSITLKLASAAHADQWLGPFAVTIVCFAVSLTLCSLFYIIVEKPLVQRLRTLLVPKKQPATSR